MGWRGEYSSPPDRPGGWVCDPCLDGDLAQREGLGRVAQAEELLEQTGIPPRYLRHRIHRVVVQGELEPDDAFRARVLGQAEAVIGATRWNRRLVEYLQAWRPGQPTAYLMGPVGGGKSVLLAALAAHWHVVRWRQGGRPVAWLSEADLVERCRRRQGSSTDWLEGVRIAVLDDLGTADDAKWAVRVTEEAIRYAYEHQVSLFVSSNLRFDELAERCGERAADRLFEITGGRQFELRGWSWRTGVPHREA